jgi:hypothetical protein
MNNVLERTLRIPTRLKTSFANYLNFFTEYIAATQGISLHTAYNLVERDTLHLQFFSEQSTSEQQETATQVLASLRGYVQNIFHETIPEIYPSLSKYEAELFLVLYKRALADIRTDIRFYYSLLSEEERLSLVQMLAFLTLTTNVASNSDVHSLSEHFPTIETQIAELRFPSEKEELPRELQNVLQNAQNPLLQKSVSVRAEANTSYSNAEEYIRVLGLQEHPEGGYFRETYRSEEEMTQLPRRFVGNRVFSTAIYFLLKHGQFSALHRIKSDELWHFYDGAPLTISCIAPNGALSEIRLGKNIAKGEVLQACVPYGWWFGAALQKHSLSYEFLHNFSLVGCTVAPGFDFADFEMPSQAEFIQMFPQHRAIIERLTHSSIR